MQAAKNVLDIELTSLEPTYVDPKENPNKMGEKEFQGLVDHIKAAGFLQPILVYATKDRPGVYKIVDGHHRFWAARAAGLTMITCVVAADLSTAKLLATAIGMNRLRGEMDLGIVGSVLSAAMDQANMDIPDLAVYSGMSEDEVRALVAPTEAPINIEDIQVSAQEEIVGEKPFVLEIPFTDKDQYVLCKKKLKKAAGASKDLAQGLLSVLGELS